MEFLALVVLDFGVATTLRGISDIASTVQFTGSISLMLQKNIT
jgi:hypothetical protein